MSIFKYYNLAKNKLFPINRSITGNGLRRTLKIIKKEFPKLKIYKVKSGSKVFDWKIPPEWNVSEAFVIDKHNKKIIDFKKNNLHLVGYSTSLNKFLSKKELFPRLHSLPKQSNAIPYVTSYYNKYWGFCLTHKDKVKFNKKYKNSDKSAKRRPEKKAIKVILPFDVSISRKSKSKLINS